MTDIHNSDIIKRIIDEAKLQTSVDDVPSKLASAIVPVLVANPKNKKKFIIFEDTTADDQDRTFAVPAGKKWVIKSIHISFNSNGTVGDRNIALMLLSTSGELLYYFIGEAQVASKAYYYNFIEGASYDATLHGDTYFCPIPIKTTLFEGEKINISEFNGVSGSDDMKNYILVEESDLLQGEYEYSLNKAA